LGDIAFPRRGLIPRENEASTREPLDLYTKCWLYL
jgi:hypothetical protein